MGQYILYFLIAISATTAGSMTGMGGGVIIKPVLDVLGQYSVETIGVLSSITVLAMALVSVGRQMTRGASVDVSIALPLAVGSVLGGAGGQVMLRAVVSAAGAERLVTALQNGVLALLIVGVFIYMLNKDAIQSPALTGSVPAALVGVSLGVISSFLGIGGGPINVALIIFLFDFNTKTAAVCSLIAILFAQVSKLAGVLLSTGFGAFDLSLLPVMICGAVAGGFIGAALSKRFSEQTVERCFNGVQLVVLAIAVFNIVRNMV